MQQIQHEKDMDKLEVTLKRIAIVVFENLEAQQLFKVHFRRKMMYTAGIET